MRPQPGWMWVPTYPPIYTPPYPPMYAPMHPPTFPMPEHNLPRPTFRRAWRRSGRGFCETHVREETVTSAEYAPGSSSDPSASATYEINAPPTERSAAELPPGVPDE